MMCYGEAHIFAPILRWKNEIYKHFIENSASSNIMIDKIFNIEMSPWNAHLKQANFMQYNAFERTKFMKMWFSKCHTNATRQKCMYWAISLAIFLSVEKRCGSRGKMEHGGKMEHQVFRKKCAMCGSVVTWFPSLAGVAWHNKIKLKDDHILNTAQNAISPYSSILMYQFAHVPASNALAK